MAVPQQTLRQVFQQTSQPIPPPSARPPSNPAKPPKPSGPEPRPGFVRSRLNAALTLLFAASAMAALAMPWATAVTARGRRSWSGLDVMDHPQWVADSLDNAVDGMRVVLVVGGLLVVLSGARVVAPGVRMVRLSLFLAAALVVAAGVSVIEFRKSLGAAGGLAPSLGTGAPFMILAAGLCLGVAMRGAPGRGAGRSVPAVGGRDRSGIG